MSGRHRHHHRVPVRASDRSLPRTSRPRHRQDQGHGDHQVVGHLLGRKLGSRVATGSGLFQFFFGTFKLKRLFSNPGIEFYSKFRERDLANELHNSDLFELHQLVCSYYRFELKALRGVISGLKSPSGKVVSIQATC